MERFAPRGDAKIKLIKVADLSDEADVAKVYAGLTAFERPLGVDPHRRRLRAGKVAQTDKTALMAAARQQLGVLLPLLPRAVNAMLAGGKGGRIVNVSARPALEPRLGAGMTRLYSRQDRRRRAHRGAGRGAAKTASWSTRSALDHGYVG